MSFTYDLFLLALIGFTVHAAACYGKTSFIVKFHPLILPVVALLLRYDPSQLTVCGKSYLCMITSWKLGYCVHNGFI